MALYGASNLEDMRAEELGNSNKLMEAYLISDLANASEEQVNQFCESALAQVLIEKSVLTKQALANIKASANKRDYNMRVKIAIYQMARERHDADYARLMKAQALKKAAVKKLYAKYGKAAQKAAMIGQKNYLKNMGKKQPSTSEDDKK